MGHYSVMELCASAIRGAIIAPKGKKLVVADLSNIEGRVLAFLAGEEWKLQAFADFDTVQTEGGAWITGTELVAAYLDRRPVPLALDAKGEPIRKGHDLYKLAYAKSFGIKPDDVTKAQRQVGKVQELACLAHDTQVITNNGIKGIMEVSLNDKLWDGTEWVQHKGLVTRGVRQVVNVAGIRATPDHLIKTGPTWTPAAKLATCESILCRALATGSANLPWSASREKNAAPASTTWFASSVRAVLNRIWCTATTSAKARAHAATPAQRKPLVIGERITSATPLCAQMTSSAGAYLTVYPQQSAAAIQRPISNGMRMAVAVSKYLSLGAKTAANSSRICTPSKTTTEASLTSTASTWIRATRQAIFGSYRPERTAAETSGLSENCKHGSTISNEKTPTFDIACSGPRNCFTVLSDRGPLLVHNCGYEGGVGAFITFATAYNIDLEAMASRAVSTLPTNILNEAARALEWTKQQNRPTFGLSDRAWLVCDSFKRSWRYAHPAISSFWKDLEEAARLAVMHPGVTYECRMLKLRRDGAWLRIRLPSGRFLCYPSPQILEDKVTYMGTNQYSRKWQRLKTYGGKLAENVTQAAARDVLAASMPAIEAAGYQIVLSVHDELITEAPDSPEFNADHLASIMATNPKWAKGLPLAAAGFEATRYRKD